MRVLELSVMTVSRPVQVKADHINTGEKSSPSLMMLSKSAVHLVVTAAIAQQHALEVSSTTSIDILTGKSLNYCVDKHTKMMHAPMDA